MGSPVVSIKPLGSKSAAIVISLEKAVLMEKEPGLWFVCDYNGRLPYKIKCEDEDIRLKMVLKLYCKSPNKQKALRRRAKRKNILIN